MDFEQLVGSRLVFGIPGTQATPEIIAHFRDTHAGGLILYRRNFESPDQLRRLITDLENGVGRRLLVTVDHEGGRVVMFGAGVTIFPSNQAIGRTGNTAFARGQGEQEGRELRRLGIDVNFAPVLDVLTEAWSPNIGIRSYGADPTLVANMGAARIAAMQVEGVSACAKHFPGLGPATLDPHVNLPVISVTWAELERVHLTPFYRAMRTAVHSIMTSHPIYPQLDPTPKTPATFSRALIYDFLRKKTGYKGVIFTDDLEMGAITQLCPIGEAAVRSAHAGHDMILVCHRMDVQKQAHRALVDAYRAGQLATKELEESVQRVATLQGRRTERFAPPPATEARAQREREETAALVRSICDQSVTVLKEGPAPRPGVATLAIYPRAGAVAARVLVENEFLDDSWLAAQLTAMGVPVIAHPVDMSPTAEQIQSACQAAGAAEQTILFLYDALADPTNRELLEAVQSSARALTVVLLRDVYDQSLVRDGVLCLTNYGVRVCDAQAVLRKLFSPANIAV